MGFSSLMKSFGDHGLNPLHAGFQQPWRSTAPGRVLNATPQPLHFGRLRKK
jgi:hypothetical protein